MVPCTIRLIDEEDGDVEDRQEIVINVLEKVTPGFLVEEERRAYQPTY